MSNLNILERGSPVLSRDLRIAGNDISQKISDLLKVDFKTAEALKIEPKGDMTDKIAMAVDSVLSNLAAEIRSSFDYYESQGASSVSKILLSGGGSLLSSLPKKLSGLLGIQADYWNPVSRIKLSSRMQSGISKQLSGQLAVAVGLALRR